MRLLLLEDDLQLGKALQESLQKTEFSVVWVRFIEDARQQLSEVEYSIALLDIALPDGDGLDLLAWIREQNMQLPVIMLTARIGVDDRVNGLNAGADDYLPKPFAIPELIARIRAASRRSSGFSQSVWRIGDLAIEPSKRRATIANSELELSQREFDLLVHLARNAGQCMTRQTLEQAIYLRPNDLESNALEVHIHNLRKKLGAQRIKTIRGIGYLLLEESL
jgi:two-component system, OmpR family, response regulator QseB